MAITLNSGSLWGSGENFSEQLLGGTPYRFTFQNANLPSNQPTAGGASFTLETNGTANQSLAPLKIFRAISPVNTPGNGDPAFTSQTPGQVQNGSFMPQFGPFATCDTKIDSIIRLEPAWVTVGLGMGMYFRVISSYEDLVGAFTAEIYSCDVNGKMTGFNKSSRGFDALTRITLPKASLDTLGATFTGPINIGVYNSLDGGNISGRLDDRIIDGNWDGFTNAGLQNSFVSSSTGFSVTVPQEGGAFLYTPSTTIDAFTSFFKGTGHYTLVITP